MEIFIILIKIALILFVGYMLFISAYHTIFKVSLDDAEKAVNVYIKNSIKAYLFNWKSVSKEPAPDTVLLNMLLDILQEVNMLESDLTAWQFYPDYYGFPTIAYDIVAPPNTDFNLLQIQMQKSTQNYLLECDYDPFVYVYSEKHGESEYYMFVCYAVYESAKAALRKFIKNRVKINRKKAIQQIAPVINDALEKEIADMKKGEKYGRL